MLHRALRAEQSALRSLFCEGKTRRKVVLKGSFSLRLARSPRFHVAVVMEVYQRHHIYEGPVMFRIECCREFRLKYVYSVMVPYGAVSVPKVTSEICFSLLSSPFSRSGRAHPFLVLCTAGFSDDAQ